MEGFDGLVVPVVARDGGTVVGGGAAATVVEITKEKEEFGVRKMEFGSCESGEVCWWWVVGGGCGGCRQNGAW